MKIFEKIDLDHSGTIDLFEFFQVTLNPKSTSNEINVSL